MLFSIRSYPASAVALASLYFERPARFRRGLIFTLDNFLFFRHRFYR